MNEYEHAEKRQNKRAEIRNKKRHPKMRVSGRGMKRFASPGRAKG